MKLLLLILTASVTVNAQLLKGASLVLDHVNIIDMIRAEPKMDMTVIIDGDQIVQIRKSRNEQFSPSDKIINGSEKFLIPGLWDMHVHLSYYGETAFHKTVAHGVLGVRDCGGKLSEIDSWRREIEEGERIGPTILRSGSFLDGPKEMSELRKGFTEIITSKPHALALVKSHNAQGVDFLKVHSRLEREYFFTIAENAKALGIPLVAHVPQYVTALEASEAGVVSIEHAESFLGASLYVEPESELIKAIDAAFAKLNGPYGKTLYKQIAENGTWVDPTLISLVRTFEGTDSSWEKNLPIKLLDVIRGLHEAGVRMVAGSDFAFTDGKIRPGWDLHGELENFVDIGMTPYEALQTATSNPPELLGLSEKWGTIEERKLANLVLLDANPLENISNTRTISAVILKGKYFNLEKLLELGLKKE